MVSFPMSGSYTDLNEITMGQAWCLVLNRLNFESLVALRERLRNRI